MEAFQANLTAVCPLPFSGATGSLFAGAIAAVVAAHCAFFDGPQWPRDNAEEIIGKRSDLSFDFIIVGAGTAGSLLANRLAKHNPSLTILLIEAGSDPGLDSESKDTENIKQQAALFLMQQSLPSNLEVPAFIFLNPNTDLDWRYETKPDGNTCQGFRNNKCIWSKGRGLGGSGSINVMLYIRGNARDFNNWESNGNSGWSYKDVSPYFAKLEKEFEFDKYNFTENPWFGILDATYTELNMTRHNINSNEANLGMRVNKLFIKNGKRLNTAKLYLSGLSNVYVMKKTLVQKIIIDPVTKTATGVEIRHSNGVVMEIESNKEVILSAGSIATPQLLMLSGIGPKNHLKEKQIQCLLDLPVGKNLQDHILLLLLLKTNMHNVLTREMITTYLLQYMLTRTGPFAGVGVTDYMAFINTDEQNYPDVQFHHTYYPKQDNFTMKPFLEGYGCKEDIIQAIQKLNEGSDLLGIFPTLLHPKSKGEVLLADNNPTSKPIIKTNYFQHPADLATLIKAIEFISKMENTSVFNAFGIQLLKIAIKKCKEADDKYWECYIGHMASSIFHPVGTAKMGPKDDETAVVDENLLVHGMKNLRIVDASIMPDIPGGNTMGPTLMIAEKAAEIIKKQYEYKDEL